MLQLIIDLVYLALKKKLKRTYVTVTDWTTVTGRAFTYKHVKAIQTGTSISTGVRPTLIDLHFTSARQKLPELPEIA